LEDAPGSGAVALAGAAGVNLSAVSEHMVAVVLGKVDLTDASPPQSVSQSVLTRRIVTLYSPGRLERVAMPIG
jgi:hypothetical protein